MNKKKQMPITNIGSVSLIMIFIVVCMITFTVLSLSEATRDYSFSKKLQQHNDEYYAASNTANEMLAALWGNIKDIKTAGDNWTEQAYKIFGDMEYAEILYNDDSGEPEGGVITIPMNDIQGIRATIVLQEPKSGSSAIKITGWQEIELKEWKGNNSLDLLR